MPSQEERRLYEKRLAIESDMYAVIGLEGFTVDDLEEFVLSVIEDIRDELEAEEN